MAYAEKKCMEKHQNSDKNRINLQKNLYSISSLEITVNLLFPSIFILKLRKIVLAF